LVAFYRPFMTCKVADKYFFWLISKSIYDSWGGLNFDSSIL
jgi:hypothetical protein